MLILPLHCHLSYLQFEKIRLSLKLLKLILTFESICYVLVSEGLHESG